MPICSLMGLAVVVMVASGGISGGGGKRGKIGWVAIGVEEGEVGARGRVRLAKSWCKKSRALSCSS